MLIKYWKINFVFALFFLLRVSVIYGAEALSVEQLAALLVEQKNYHELSKTGRVHEPFVTQIKQIYEEHGVASSWDYASGALPGQPLVPVVIFRPASATPEKPAPLIVHVHGGPRI
jgi:acetyl esterase/lipase